MLEREPLEKAVKGRINGLPSSRLRQCMDTKRDQELLEFLWLKGAPWKR